MREKNQYLEFLEEWLAPLGEITKKYMFGGYCLYCDGAVFALVADNALFLKADAVNRPDFEAIGAQQFQPFPDKPEMSMSYYSPPANFFDDPDVMLEWGRAAVEAGRRGGKKKKKPAKKSSASN